MSAIKTIQRIAEAYAKDMSVICPQQNVSGYIYLCDSNGMPMYLPEGVTHIEGNVGDVRYHVDDTCAVFTRTLGVVDRNSAAYASQSELFNNAMHSPADLLSGLLESSISYVSSHTPDDKDYGHHLGLLSCWVAYAFTDEEKYADDSLYTLWHSEGDDTIVMRRYIGVSRWPTVTFSDDKYLLVGKLDESNQHALRFVRKFTAIANERVDATESDAKHCVVRQANIDEHYYEDDNLSADDEVTASLAQMCGSLAQDPVIIRTRRSEYVLAKTHSITLCETHAISALSSAHMSYIEQHVIEDSEAPYLSDIELCYLNAALSLKLRPIHEFALVSDLTNGPARVNVNMTPEGNTYFAYWMVGNKSATTPDGRFTIKQRNTFSCNYASPDMNMMLVMLTIERDNDSEII